MTSLSRRTFLSTFARSGLAGSAAVAMPSLAAPRKMKIALTPGSIGVEANQQEAIELAARHGFEAVEPYSRELAGLSSDQLQRTVDEVEEKGLVWASAGLPVEFRQDRARFQQDVKDLPNRVKALQRAGVDRIGTYIMPMHDKRTFLQNLRLHAERLGEVARICGDAGLRLGLEYVGTKTLWTRDRYAFVHTMAETKELIDEIGQKNVGFVLDTWHWWTSNETAADLLTLTNDQIVSCDLNDAPMGIPKEQQQDLQRALPASTGLIDVRSFLRALQELGYDGPVRPEPFSASLNTLPNDQACGITIRAMKRAFAVLD